MGSVILGNRTGRGFFRRALSLALATLIGFAAFATIGVSSAAADTGAVSIDTSPDARVAIAPAGVALTWSITAPDASSCVLTNTASNTVEATQICGNGDVALTASAEGPHTLTVTSATDSADVVTSAIVDVVPPTPTITAAPTSPDSDPTPTWSFDPIVSDASVTCTLTHGATTVATQTDCASPFTADDLSASATAGDPGNYTLTLTQSLDSETSDPSTGSTYDFEPAGLAAPVVTADQAHGVDRHPTFTVTGLGTGATVDCSVDPPAGGPAVAVAECDAAGTGSYQLDLSGGDVGTYTLHVTQTVDGVTSDPGSDTYTLDVTAPTVDAAQAAGAGAHPHFTISGLDAGTTPVCTVNGPSIDHQSITCDATTSLDLSGDDPGTYTLTVRAQDGAGNLSDPVTATYEYEPSGPPAPTVTAPSATGIDLTPTFTVDDAEDVSLSYQCSIVGTDPENTVVVPNADCGTSTTVDLTGLPDDVYTLTVTATDAVGNVSDPGTATYTLDTSTPAPTVTLATPASSPSSETKPSYTFDDTESVDGPDRFSCVWTSPAGDTLSSGSCASLDSFDTAGKGDGTYTLEVTAHDTLDNHAATTVTYVLEADVPPPPTVAVIGATSGSARAVSFSVSDSETVDDLTYTCTLSGGDLTDVPVAPCGTTTDVVIGATEPDGPYTLSVTATDGLDHTSDPGTATYTLDTVAQAPTIGLVTPARSPSKDNAPVFAITDNELVGGADTFTCTWTGPGKLFVVPGPCPAGNQFSALLDGEYTLSVTATDTAGNVSDPATFSYDLDTAAPVAPTVALSAPASSPNTVTTPTFSVSNSGDTSPGGLIYSCVVTDTASSVVVPASDVSCGPTTTVDLSDTGDGRYRVAVTATDAAGNVSAGAGTAFYRLDTVAQAPTVTLLTPASSPARSSLPTFSITDNEIVDGPDTFACTWSGPGITPSPASCASADSFPASVDGVYTLSVVATDLLGNVSSAGVATYERDATAQSPSVALATPLSSPSSVVSPTFSIADNELLDGPDTFMCTWSGPGIASPSAVACSDGDGFAVVSDGDYTLSVTATDSLGNVSVPVTASYSYDGSAQAPDVSLAVPASSPSNVVSPTFTITGTEVADGPDVFSCTWSGPGVVATGPVPCVSGAAFGTVDDGDYTLSVTATDTLGNLSVPATVTYTYDGTAPDSPTVALSSPVSSPNKVTTPTFAVSNPGDTSPGGLIYSCVMTNTTLGVIVAASNVTCGPTTTADLASTGDGDYTLSVTATDAAGNLSATPGTATYTLDQTAPAPTVTLLTPASSPGTSSAPTFQIADNEIFDAPATFMCTWSGPGIPAPLPAACLSGDSFPASVDGVYTLSVVATDLLGNVSSAGVATYERDATAQSPSVALATPLSSPSSVVSPTFSIADNELLDGPDTFMCTWSGPGIASPSAVACSDGDGFAVVSDGDYTLSVTATDSLGNVSVPVTASYSYDGSAQAPDVSLAVPASSPSNVVSPTFTITGTEVADGPDVFSCTWSGPGVVATGPVPCVSGAAFGTVDDGDYTLSVTATDTLGNLSVPATVTYTYDGTAPDSPTVALSSPVSSPNKVTTPTFAVSNPGDTSPGGLIYSCVMTNTTLGVIVAASNVTCGPTTTADLASTGDGDYTLSVTATDAAGNLSATPGTATYTLDTAVPAAPTVVLTDPSSSPGDLTNPTFAVSEPGDTSPGAMTYSCVVTKTSASPVVTLPGTDVACGATTQLDLSATGDGDYTLSVTATDAAGNVSATPGAATYTLDTGAPGQPVVVLTNPASSPGNVTSPTFSVSVPGDDSPGTMGYSCLVTDTTTGVVVADSAVTCGATTTADLTATGDGDYTIAVTAIDAAGNTSASAGSATYTLDATPPDAPDVVLVTPASSPSQDKTPTFSVSNVGDVSPGGLDYSCVVTNTSTGDVVADSDVSCGTTTSVDLTATGDGTYSVAVTATDKAGNVSDPGTAAYALDTTPPGAPTVTLVNPASSPGNVTSPRFAVTNPGDVSPGAMSYTCTVTKTAPTMLTVDPSRVSCGSTTTVDLAATGDGTYVLTVSATDAAGNVGTAQGNATYVLDTSAPPAPVITVPKSSTMLPTFGITDGDPTATLHCLFIGPGGVTVFPMGGSDVCPPNGTFDTSAFPDGVYTLTVTAVDPAGNSASTTVTWTRDTTPPPPPTVVAPKSPSKDRNPVFTISDTEANVTFSCVMIGPDSTTVFSGTCPASGQFSLTGADGEYILTVTATDAAGNVQPTTTSASYVLDTTAPAPPTVVRTSPLTSPAQSAMAEFSVTDPDSSPGGITFGCSVTGPTTVPDAAIQCGGASRIDLSGPDRDGTYTLAVFATDAAGNVSATPGTADYTLDTTPPATPNIALVQPAASPGNVATPTFSVTDEDTSDGLTFACSVTGVTPVPDSAVACGSTTTIDLGGEGRDGAYTLSVTATDFAGNTSTTAGTFDYILDTQAPAPALVQLATATRSNDPRPLWTWQYGPDDTGSGTTPTIAPRPDGAAEVGLTATCQITGPAGWSSSTAGCAHHFRTLLGGGDGTYKFTVTLADAAGNTTSAAPASYRLDSTAPTGAAVFLRRPASTVGLDRHPIWIIKGPATSTFRCTLLEGGPNGRPLAPESTCTNPTSFSLAGMPDDTYTLKVVALDAVGNRAFPAYASYILEPLAPKVKAPQGTGSLAVWTVIGNPNDRLECTLDRFGGVVVSAETCDSHPTFDMSSRPAGLYTLSAVQIGAGGTRSASGSASWFWSGSVSNTGGPGGSPSHQANGPTGRKNPTNGNPLAGLSGLVRHQIRNVVHNSGKTVASHFPAIPHPIGVGSGVVSAVQNAVQTIGAAGGGTGFPLLLVALVLAFLIAQNRIDRRDPKLALASIAADDMVEFQLPPSRRERP